jgi:hypothetical protein
MRDIRFRAQRVDTKEWVYGTALHHNHKYILDDCYDNNYDDWIKIIPETIGQFAELFDKNNVPIYDGDKIIADWYWTKEHVFNYPNDVGNLCEFGLDGENLKVVGNIYDDKKQL